MRPDESARELLAPFSDPAAVARYAKGPGPARFVPGYAELHRMTGILLAERAPKDARILVLGAGGGLELKALAEAYPGWTFVGIDPAAEMLNLAERTLGPLAERVQLREGYIDDAPEGPFDAATCLLTLHFLDTAERQRTAGEIRRRLKPGAPFVAAHASCPRGRDERARWLSRYTAFGIASGADPEHADKARATIEARLDKLMLGPEEDAAVLRRAGFSDIELFYAAFTWRGWVGYA